MKDLLKSSKIKFFQIAITILLLFQISSEESSCSNANSLTDSNCFNNLIKLNNYRSGQFEKDKEGSMFILYSNSITKSKRLFYSLKKNGNNYFEEGYQKEIQITPPDSNAERDESKIIFVSIDGNDKQYLFSTSAGYPQSTLVELYGIEENRINVKNNIK